MSKREKIIVGLMVAAILYGGYNFLFSGSGSGKKKLAGPQQVAINAFVTDLVKKVKAADKTATATLVLKKASAPWPKDLFLVIPKEADAEEKADKEPEIIDRKDLAGAFHYSGYMEMGKRKLAIINAMEYQTGDRLDAQGAVLKKITRSEVHVYVGAEQGIIVVPIDETVTQ